MSNLGYFIVLLLWPERPKAIFSLPGKGVSSLLEKILYYNKYHFFCQPEIISL